MEQQDCGPKRVKLETRGGLQLTGRRTFILAGVVTFRQLDGRGSSKHVACIGKHIRRAGGLRGAASVCKINLRS